jgi:formamidopyrimidine-DNA glycosylase
MPLELDSDVPELPEVETVRRQLAPWLTGRLILGARRVDAPDGPKYRGLTRAVGQRIERVDRLGKFIVMPLSGGDELVVHLGMTGVVSADRPADHVRVALELDGSEPRTLHFRDPRRFGRFVVLAPGERHHLPTLAAIGPEPLSDAFDLEGFAQALATRRAGVKAVLLSQRVVAGVGNIYADEALWRARVHPEAPCYRLARNRVAALHRAIREVLAAGLDDGGTTLRDYRGVDGAKGSHQDALAAYGREGEPCLKCGKPLERIVVGQRGTSYCPRCQAMPRAPRRPG